jgi:hypothetical protein
MNRASIASGLTCILNVRPSRCLARKLLLRVIASGRDRNLRKRDRLIKVSRSNKSQAILASERSLVVHEESPGSSIDLLILALSLRYYRSDGRFCCAVLFCSEGPRIWLEVMASRGILFLWARAASVRSKQQEGQCPSSCSSSSLSLLLPFPLPPLTTPLVAGRASDQTLSPCSTSGLRHPFNPSLPTIYHQPFIPSNHPSTTTTTITLFSFPLSSSGPRPTRP